jgi:ATP-binding cassette, subfamily G (WHITE), eye pigment precursor transporter
MGRVAISIFISLLSLSIFWDCGRQVETTTGHTQFVEASDLASSLFFTCIAQLSLYEFATVLEFQKERAVFIREKASGMYSISPYYLSKLLLEFPLLLALPLLENLMTFYGIGYMSENHNFWKFYLVYFATVQVGTAMGYFISCCFDNMMSASQVTPFAVMPSVLFGGFVVNLSTLSPWVSWFQYLSPTRFAFEALLWAQWPDDELGMQNHFSFSIGYGMCVAYLIIMAIIYRAITLVFFSLLSRKSF